MRTSIATHPEAKWRALRFAAVACALASTPLHAQPADAPDLRVGDRWQFVEYYSVPSSVPNRTWLVTAVHGETIDATENGEPLRLTRELNVLESPRSAYSNAKALSFPLDVGKRWRYRTDWLFKAKRSNGWSDVDVAVVSRERVRVPAGEFDAYRIEASASLNGTSPVGSIYAGRATMTYWYAPDVRAIVRAVSRNPYLGTSTVDLVAFRPGE